MIVFLCVPGPNATVYEDSLRQLFVEVTSPSVKSNDPKLNIHVLKHAPFQKPNDAILASFGKYRYSSWRPIWRLNVSIPLYERNFKDCIQLLVIRSACKFIVSNMHTCQAVLKQNKKTTSCCQFVTVKRDLCVTPE